MQAGDRPNPFLALAGSRKFLLMVLDVTLSIIGHFAGQYASPAAQENIHFLTLTLQPVFVTLILSIAHEDASETKATIAAQAAVEVATVTAAPSMPPADPAPVVKGKPKG